MEDVFVRFVNSSVNDVLTTMANIHDIKNGTPYTKDSTTKALGDISVIIGFSGETVRGTFILHYTQAMAFMLLEKAFAMEASEVNDEVLDAVGEMTNMICGKIKTDVVNAGVPEFNISIPTIIVGHDFQTHIKMNDVAIIFPFQTQVPQQNLNLELKVKRLK